MKPDIFIISLGCPRNLVDSEVLAGKLKKNGFRIFYEPRKNCVAIVNTCAFIEDAKNESINIILELAGMKAKGSIARLIVTGCLSQRYQRELMREIREIDGIFGSGTFFAIPDYIGRILKDEKVAKVNKIPRFLYDHSQSRLALTPRHSVYVKIQEGCRNFCSYCIIPKIKGPYRSRGMESILSEVGSFKKRGAKEINLIGQDTTSYGIDRYKALRLAPLLVKISQIMKGGWVRLLYTHPAHYNQDLIEVIRGEGAVCKYLDLPIQHISDKILKKMNRHVGPKGIISLIEKIRKAVPGIAIRTTVMVGFPGESEKDFSELEKFITETKFERLGVFVYSREEQTRAFDFPDQVPEKVKEERFRRIMEAQNRISEENNRCYMGKRIKVLIDEKDQSEKCQYLARTQSDAPEVDGLVYVKSEKALKEGDFVDVKIEDTLEYDLVGSV
ncbi:MAG: 30S ribosomal protein S12 methylthiotransferase RimO [Candidatus Omnitrophota bacterium]